MCKYRTMNIDDDDDCWSEQSVEQSVETNVCVGFCPAVYYSDVEGSSIVDAITGAKYPWRVGTIDENRFFRVMSTTAHTNYERKGNSNNYERRSSRKAFYETPYRYMEHHNVNLNNDIVKCWFDKVCELYPGEYNYRGAA